MALRRPIADTDAFIQFGELTYYCAYAHAVRLKKVQLEEDDKRWRVRLKGVRRGENLVAYLNAPSYTSLVVLIGELSDKDTLNWYPDRYP